MQRILLSIFVYLTTLSLYAMSPSEEWKVFTSQKNNYIRNLRAHGGKIAVVTSFNEVCVVLDPRMFNPEILVKGYLRYNHGKRLPCDIANICWEYMGNSIVLGKYKAELGKNILLLEFSPDGSMLLIVTEESGMLVNIQKGITAKIDLKNPIRRAVFNADSTMVAISYHAEKSFKIDIWKVASWLCGNPEKSDFSISCNGPDDLCWISKDTIAVGEGNQIVLYKEPFKLFNKKLSAYETPVKYLVSNCSCDRFVSVDESLTFVIWNSEGKEIDRYVGVRNDNIVEIKVYRDRALIKTIGRIYLWESKKGFVSKEIETLFSCISGDYLYYLRYNNSLVKATIDGAKELKTITCPIDRTGLEEDEMYGVVYRQDGSELYGRALGSIEGFFDYSPLSTNKEWETPYMSSKQ